MKHLPGLLDPKPDPPLPRAARVSRTKDAWRGMQRVLWVLAWFVLGVFASTYFDGFGYQVLAIIWCLVFALCTLVYFDRSQRRRQRAKFMQ